MTRRRPLWSRILRGLIGAALVLVIAAVISAALIGRPPVREASQAEIPPPVIDTAPGSGKPTLILLHGAALNAHMWDAVIEHVDPSYRVVAIDLPGHGARRDGVYTLEAARAAVTAAAKGVSPAPVILAGDSLGGYTALASASLLPKEQLRGLVLSGCSANFTGFTPRFNYRRDQVLYRNLLALVDERKFAERALERFGVAERYRPAMLDAGINLRAIEPAVESLLGIDFLPMLAAFDRPILVLNGSRDERAVAGEASFVAAAPHATSKDFEGVEHGISIRRPVEFADELNRFAARTFAPQ